MINEQTCSMLINYFNACTGLRLRTQNKNNLEAVNVALEKANGDAAVIRKYFKEKISELKAAKQPFDLIAICNDYSGVVVELEPVEEKLAAPAQDKAQSAIDLMGQVMVELLAKTKLQDVENEVSKRLEEHARQFILDHYGPIQRKIEIELDGKKTELEGVVHSKFDQVLKFVKAGEPVFLTGPAGAGKNVLCQQVAKALGLKFYFSNAVTQEYKITGFTDAMGAFQESQFYKAFKYGGLFMLDEMDASIPEVLIILNAAIANRYFDFPAPIGYVEAHPDFRVIAAGNTFGLGADYDYVGRNQLDAASLDRFAMIRIDYDPHIEEACAAGNVELLNFCRKFRAATKKAGIRTVVSYRAISRMAKLDSVMEADELLDSCLIKSLDAGDLDTIKAECAGCGKYSAALLKILEMRRAS